MFIDRSIFFFFFRQNFLIFHRIEDEKDETQNFYIEALDPLSLHDVAIGIENMLIILRENGNKMKWIALT